MSFFACCFRRRNRHTTEDGQHALHEPPEISWENSLGSPNGVPFDEATKELLHECLEAKQPSPTTLTEIIKRSEGFPVPFPVNAVRSFAFRDRGLGMDALEFNANSAYPLIHEATLPLIAGWLKYKRQYGSAIERSLYRDMGLVQLIQRLLEKRALQFYGSDDRYCLVDGSSGNGGWEDVGTEMEKEPLILASCLSYDEMKLSATIIVSSHTEFINDGSRENRGVVCDDLDSIQPRGVIMSVVGTRLERPRVMEYQDILVTHLQNNMDNGYGPPVEGTTEEKRGLRCVWARFYGDDYLLIYDEAMRRVKLRDKRYVPLTGQIIFDAENYMKRTLMSVEMILLEANTRAEKHNTTAFLHVVGFGLGVWKIIHDQEVYFLKTFEIALRKMNKKLRYVSDIMFSYFRQQKCGGASNGDYLGDIRIHFALREPQTKLFRSSDANKLLIVTYAADGNSYPGNEFWGNYLTASSEPAAACSTQISELHNPRINPRACGANLHVASLEHGIVHIGDYAKLHLTPPGTDQQSRRPSRSPRNQRSRSADVDCLKKYMERRVEMRRHTEAGETSHWIPLTTKSPVRPYVPTKDNSSSCANGPAGAKGSLAPATVTIKEGKAYQYNPGTDGPSTRRFASDETEAVRTKWPPILKRSSNFKSTNEEETEDERKAIRQSAGRSFSADVTYLRRDSASRWNERYVNFADRAKLVSVAPTSRCAASPLPRRTSESDGLQGPESARWATYARYPSPGSYQRKMSERCFDDSKRASIAEAIDEDADSREEAELPKEVVGCQLKLDEGPKRPSIQGNLEPTTTDVSNVNQRLRELYDFKIETKWPKRVRKSSHETTWISKSSIDIDKSQQHPEFLASFERRDNQDVQLNDRSNSKANEAIQKPRTRLLPELPTTKRDSVHDQIFRRSSFIDKLEVVRRRTYSDDYENSNRRKSFVTLRDLRWNSDSTAKSNYLEIESLHQPTRSVISSNQRSQESKFLYEAERSGGNCEARRYDRIEVSHKRSLSHYEPKIRTLHPPPEIDDLYKDFSAGSLNDRSTNRKLSTDLRRNSIWYDTYHN